MVSIGAIFSIRNEWWHFPRKTWIFQEVLSCFSKLNSVIFEWICVGESARNYKSVAAQNLHPHLLIENLSRQKNLVMSEFKRATIRFRLEHRKVVPGQFPGLLFPEDSWGHPIGADWHPEQDRASHLWALLWHQDEHPQHQKSSAGRVLHAGGNPRPSE